MPTGSTFPPPLPEEWPYQDRRLLEETASSEGQVLPGLEGRWHLRLKPGLTLDHPIEPLGGAFGRGGVLRTGGVVLRPYRRGGLLRHLNPRTYASPRRFAREFAVHAALWAAGFPTVEPLGYAWRRHRLGVEGAFLSAWVDAPPWPRRWDLSDQVLPALNQAIRALCAWGLWSPDLNATNVLVHPRGILLLDWDRAGFQPGPVPFEFFRARMARSLARLDAPAAVQAAFAAGAATGPPHP